MEATGIRPLSPVFGWRRALRNWGDVAGGDCVRWVANFLVKAAWAAWTGMSWFVLGAFFEHVPRMAWNLRERPSVCRGPRCVYECTFSRCWYLSNKNSNQKKLQGNQNVVLVGKGEKRNREGPAGPVVRLSKGDGRWEMVDGDAHGKQGAWPGQSGPLLTPIHAAILEILPFPDCATARL